MMEFFFCNFGYMMSSLATGTGRNAPLLLLSFGLYCATVLLALTPVFLQMFALRTGTMLYPNKGDPIITTIVDANVNSCFVDSAFWAIAVCNRVAKRTQKWQLRAIYLPEALSPSYFLLEVAAMMISSAIEGIIVSPSPHGRVTCGILAAVNFAVTFAFTVVTIAKAPCSTRANNVALSFNLLSTSAILLAITLHRFAVWQGDVEFVLCAQKTQRPRWRLKVTGPLMGCWPSSCKFYKILFWLFRLCLSQKKVYQEPPPHTKSYCTSNGLILGFFFF